MGIVESHFLGVQILVIYWEFSGFRPGFAGFVPL